MATVDSAVETPVDPDTQLVARIGRFFSRAPIHIVLVLLAVFWLIPTTGLFITSLLTPSVHSFPTRRSSDLDRKSVV